MSIRDSDVIADRYDVVVVGAGIGGLTAAALLAKRGLSTLVVEHHYLPGGCCTALRRKGYTFDVGPELLYGFETSGYNPHRFVMNELEESIDLIRHDYVYRMRLPRGTVTFWRDQERFLAELCALYPHEESGIRALFADMYQVHNAVMGGELVAVVPPSEASRGTSPINGQASPAALARVGEMLQRDSRWLIDQYISDPEVINFFDIVAATFTSCDLAETPAILTAVMFIDNHAGGTCYAADTPQMLSNLLEKAIEKHGGRMLYRNRVDEILISDGEAHGVRLADGTEISAGAVVSNATVWNLYGGLVRSEHIEPGRMEWAHAFDPTFSFLVAYLGIDASVLPEDFGHVEMIVLDPTGFEGLGNFNIELPSLEDAARCPPGKHAMTVVSPNRRVWPRPNDPSYRSEDYEKLKAEETEDLLGRLERCMPGLRDAIEVIEIGTPTTVERYTLRNWGNLGGPKPSMGQHMLQRPHARSDWQNLFLCGDSTVMGEGVVASTSSGIGAANMILRDRGLEEYVPHHFERQYVNFVPARTWTPAPSRETPLVPSVAQRLARECRLCEDAPCIRACPASIDIPGFLRRIETGNFTGAAAAVRETNPFAQACGLICPSERLCESVCRHLEYTDEPVRIADLHGWVAGHIPQDDGWRPPAASGHRRVAVVGAGPAGLACAYFLARDGYTVDVLDQAERAGGILTHAVPESRLPDHVMTREIRGMTLPSMSFRFGVTLGSDVTISSLEAGYDAVFLAPGLSSGRTIDIPGIGDANVTDALSFLQSARKHGDLHAAGRVLVVGGGSVATDAALTAVAGGATAVTVVCLEREDDMPALRSEIAELRQDAISLFDGWGPREVRESRRLVFARCVSVLDATGRFAPTFDYDETMEQEFDLAILAVGQRIDDLLARHLEGELGRPGLVRCDPDTLQVLGHPKLYAGGDIVRGAGTAVEAVGDGRRAAASIAAALTPAGA